jgi:hypothetical protein
MKLNLFKFAVLLMVAHISVSQETDAEKDIVLKKNENAQETAKIETNNAAETEQPDQDFKPAEDISEDYPVPLPSDI